MAKGVLECIASFSLLRFNGGVEIGHRSFSSLACLWRFKLSPWGESFPILQNSKLSIRHWTFSEFSHREEPARH